MENNAQESFFFSHPWLVAAIAGITYSLLPLIRALLHPLREVPGPLSARFTRLWYLRAVNKGDFEKTNINLHKAYGPIVRIAPGQYSIDDPEAIRTIYSHSSSFVKAPWYLASSNPNPVSRDLFTDVDPRRHGVNRRKVASLYSMTSLVQMESCVTECTAVLMERLEEFAASGQSFNLQQWMQFYAFDAIGLITVNKRFGFLDSGKDQDGLIAALHSYLVYAAHVGIFNEFHSLLTRILSWLPAGGIAHLVAFASQQISEGQNMFTAKDSNDLSDPFLKKLLAIHSQDPEKISKADIFTTCITNIGAGSDSTSISLTAILYNLCKHQNVYQKLREEVELAETEGRLSVPEITFHEAQALPYLQACIKEGLRLYPATGLPLARVVPKGGATLCGKYFPEGEIVGINAWVSNRNKTVFGDDADSYRPERWLENPTKVSAMERNFLSFGAGARTCIGKNISLMEMGKLIPALIRRFDFELIDSGAEVTTQNVWFVKQLDIQCRVRLRHT
ncbi:cytochrome P450 [Aspergillus pseudoustus]|uniref:Cytochrome P450 n=1 Tax=Aspergillus pseudoustus TaxID=1810923 RepID=A0ABR4JH79_9EURO